MTRIFVLGNAGMDLTLVVPRLPAAGETLVGSDLLRAPGGKGLNQAVAAARAGAWVCLAAALGDDPDGDAVAVALAAEPIAALRLRRAGGPSDMSMVLVAPDGENCIVSSGARAEAYPPAEAASFADGLERGDWLLMQGNLSWDATLAAAEAARRRGARIMLNAAPPRWPQETRRFAWDVLVVNQSEAAGLTGACGAAGARLLRERGTALAIVTMGAAGCAVAHSGGMEIVAAPAVTAIDSTGAGDAFCGMLARCLAADMAWPASVAAAQRTAASTVGRRGAFAALPMPAGMREILGSGASDVGGLRLPG